MIEVVITWVIVAVCLIVPVWALWKYTEGRTWGYEYRCHQCDFYCNGEFRNEFDRDAALLEVMGQHFGHQHIERKTWVLF